MSESKQKPATKARPAAKAPSKATSRASRTSSGSIKAPSATKTSSGSIKAPGATKTSSGSIKAPSATKTSSGSVKATSATKTSSGSVRAATKKAAPKARAKVGRATSAEASAKAKPTRKPVTKATAPTIEVEPILVPDVVIVPQQLSMEPLVEATLVEDTVVELPKKPKDEPERAQHAGARPVETHPRTEKASEMAVDGWAAQTLDAAQRSLIEAIRVVVGRVAPKALESAKWRRATSDGQRSSGFLRDAQLPGARDVIEEAGERVRRLTTRIGEQLPLEVIERFLRDAVKRRDGKSSKRAR